MEILTSPIIITQKNNIETKHNNDVTGIDFCH